MFLEKELIFNEQIVEKTYFFCCYFANCKCFHLQTDTNREMILLHYNCHDGDRTGLNKTNKKKKVLKSVHNPILFITIDNDYI